MSIQKYDPFKNLVLGTEDLLSWGDLFFPKRYLDQAWNMFEKDAHKGFPKYNITERDDKYILEFLLAGYKPEDLRVETEGDYLVVSSERQEQLKGRGFAAASFRVPFVAKGLDLEKVKAKYLHGLLTIEVPKRQAKKLDNKKIKIETQ